MSTTSIFSSYWFNPSLALLRELESRIIRRWLAALAPGSILDAGCGSGRFALSLGASMITGIDSDSDKVAIAKALGAHSEVYCLRMEDAPDALRRQYDVVVLNSVLEHVDEPRNIIRALARLCHDGGHLILTVPMPQGSYRWQRVKGQGLSQVAFEQAYNLFLSHKTYFSLQDISVLAEDAGFELVETLPYLGGPTKAFADAFSPFALHMHEQARTSLGPYAGLMETSAGAYLERVLGDLLSEDLGCADGTSLAALLRRH